MQFMLSKHRSPPLEALLSRHATDIIIKDEFGRQDGARADLGKAAGRAGLVYGDE